MSFFESIPEPPPPSELRPDGVIPGVTPAALSLICTDKVAVAISGLRAYPNGFEFTLDCPNNRYVNDEKICLAVVSMWSKIGITARLTAQPMSQHR